MSFYHQIQDQTQSEREYLLTSPIIQSCLAGQITVPQYVAFLQQAYHHVRHTTPLLMAVGSRLPPEQEWLREAVAEYIEEELGHQEWILNDIAACGYDKEEARHSTPNYATEMMVAYAYDTIARCNPLGFFGMVNVLEGTSIHIADAAADRISETTGLPKQAFSYLRSHGKLDQEHIVFFQSLMDRIEAREDQAAIVHAAKRFYRLYADVFRELDPKQVVALAA